MMGVGQRSLLEYASRSPQPPRRTTRCAVTFKSARRPAADAGGGRAGGTRPIASRTVNGVARAYVEDVQAFETTVRDLATVLNGIPTANSAYMHPAAASV